MNKQDLKSTLEKSGKDFLGLYEVAQIVGVDRGTMRGWLHGVSYLRNGNRKLYHINDICERLMQLREK